MPPLWGTSGSEASRRAGFEAQKIDGLRCISWPTPAPVEGVLTAPGKAAVPERFPRRRDGSVPFRALPSAAPSTAPPGCYERVLTLEKRTGCPKLMADPRPPLREYLSLLVTLGRD